MIQINKKSLLQLTLFLGVAAILIYWQFSSITPEQLANIKDSIMNARWAYLTIAIAIAFFANWVRAKRWQQFFASIGEQTTTKNTLLGLILGYFVNSLVPRAGEVVRCTTVAKYDKVPVEKAFGTVVSERVFDLLCLLFVFAFVFLFQYDLLLPYVQDLKQQFLSKQRENSMVNLVVILLVLSLFIALFIIIIKRFKGSKVANFLGGLLDGLKAILIIRNKALFLLYTIGMWGAYFLATWIVFQMMDFTDHLGVMEAITITAFGSIAIIVTPGGIGAYPPICAAILEVYAVEYTSGLAFGWLAWVVQLFIVLILGISSLIALPLVNKSPT